MAGRWWKGGRELGTVGVRYRMVGVAENSMVKKITSFGQFFPGGVVELGI